MTDGSYVEARADHLSSNRKPEVLPMPGGKPGHLLLLPTEKGWQVKTTKALEEEYADRPERRTGTARLPDMASFLAWIDRFKDEHSAVFVNPNVEADPHNAGITCIADYHRPASAADGARFGEHRAFYPFPLSRAWKIWAAIEKASWMAQAEFALTIENNIADITTPPPHMPVEDEKLEEVYGPVRAALDRLGAQATIGPQKMLELSRGLEMNASVAAREVVNLQNGVRQIHYVEQHTDGSGAPLAVPDSFVLGIQVFEREGGFMLPVRLRYLRNGQVLKWAILRFEPQRFVDFAVEELLGQVRETGLPVFIGSPEG
jgi:hypothetical protein